MKQRTNIGAEIERNRIALLRMVYCWLSAALCLNIRSDKPIPKRLSAWANELISTAEKATGYLLIAIFYQSQIKKYSSSEFEKIAHNLLASHGAITLGALTIAGIIQRLKALQHILHNLRFMARRLAKSVAAHARVLQMKMAALVYNPRAILPPNAAIALQEKALPP